MSPINQIVVKVPLGFLYKQTSRFQTMGVASSTSEVIYNVFSSSLSSIYCTSHARDVSLLWC